MDTQRFHDDGRTLATFHDCILVECPLCHHCAQVVPLDTTLGVYGKPRRVTCHYCAYTRTWPTVASTSRQQWGKEATHAGQRRQVSTETWAALAQYGAKQPYGVLCDPFFSLPLYLQTECLGERLWAYNVEHLNVLESFIAAPLREMPRKKQTHPPMSMVQKLPRWMILAEHREAVLKGIERLRARLVE